MPLAAKLVAIMQAVDHVDKRGKNQAQGYNYVKATDVARAVRAECIKQKVIILPDVVSEERWNESRFKDGIVVGTMNYCKVVLAITFRDAESEETLGPLRSVGWGQDVGDKAAYKAMTGALKYALRNPFLIPDESDPENDEGESRDVKQTKRASETKPAITREPSKPYAAPGRTDGEPRPQPNGALISDKQAAMLWAIGKNRGMTEDGIKSLLGRHGFEHTKEVTRAAFDAILKEIQQ